MNTDKDKLFPIHLEKLHLINNNILNCHWHNKVEFIYIESGEAIFVVDDKNFKAHKGEVVIIESLKLHSAYTENNEECTIKSILFNIEMLSSKSSDAIQLKFINPLINNTITLPLHLKCQSNMIENEEDADKNKIDIFKTECQIRDIIISLSNALEYKEENYELIAKSYLYMIFSKLLLLCDKHKQNDSNGISNRFKEVLSYIHTNYNSPITIKELAQIINISEGHLCRIFKSLTLKTPIDYINYYRIIKAQDMLLNTNKSITDICLDTGFNNLSYFINIFKKSTGYTPFKFRKNFNSSKLNAY